MTKIWIVAWREFLDTVRTRAFLFGVILMPTIMIGMIYGTERIARAAGREALPARDLAVIDFSGVVWPEFNTAMEQYNRENPQRRFNLTAIDPQDYHEEQLVSRVNSGQLFGFIEIPAAAVRPATATPTTSQPAAAPSARFVRRDNELSAARLIREVLNQSVIDARFRSHEPSIEPKLVEQLSRRIAFVEVDSVSGAIAADDEHGRMIAPFVVMMLIYLAMMSISMGLLTGVLEEKSSRIMEVLLAAISPMQLMAGKILGIAAVGLVMMAIWCGVGLVSARSYGLEHIVSGYRLTMVALYFLPALLFSAAILAAIGSACNTLKEAQSLSSPLTMFNILPMLFWPAIVPNPGSALALTLSFIPPITPFVMILRICADPTTPAWQIVATLALLWLTVLATFWFAAKVFRIGVLMHGQPPTIKQLIRWARQA